MPSRWAVDRTDTGNVSIYYSIRSYLENEMVLHHPSEGGSAEGLGLRVVAELTISQSFKVYTYYHLRITTLRLFYANS